MNIKRLISPLDMSEVSFSMGVIVVVDDYDNAETVSFLEKWRESDNIVDATFAETKKQGEHSKA